MLSAFWLAGCYGLFMVLALGWDDPDSSCGCLEPSWPSVGITRFQLWSYEGVASSQIVLAGYLRSVLLVLDLLGSPMDCRCLWSYSFRVFYFE
jgi:hypothetical protein